MVVPCTHCTVWYIASHHRQKTLIDKNIHRIFNGVVPLIGCSHSLFLFHLVFVVNLGIVCYIYSASGCLKQHFIRGFIFRFLFGVVTIISWSVFLFRQGEEHFQLYVIMLCCQLVKMSLLLRCNSFVLMFALFIVLLIS